MAQQDAMLEQGWSVLTAEQKVELYASAYRDIASLVTESRPKGARPGCAQDRIAAALVRGQRGMPVEELAPEYLPIEERLWFYRWVMARVEVILRRARRWDDTLTRIDERRQAVLWGVAAVQAVDFDALWVRG